MLVQPYTARSIRSALSSTEVALPYFCRLKVGPFEAWNYAYRSQGYKLLCKIPAHLSSQTSSNFTGPKATKISVTRSSIIKLT